MKKYILIILIFILSVNIHSQNLSHEERQHWVGVLDSTSYFDREEAIKNIYADSIYEAVPKIVQLFWKSDAIDECAYLQLLQYLDAPETYTFTQLILDSLRLNPCPYSLEDQLWFKKYVTKVLFNRGDYSTAEYVFELIDSLKGQDMIPVDLLAEVCKYVPQYSERAKNLLITIAKSNSYNLSYDNAGYNALWYLEELFGAQETEIYKDILLSNLEEINKIRTLDYLVKYRYPQLDSLLKANITNEVIPYIRFLFIETILENYCTVQNIKWVKEYIPAESDAKYKSYMSVGLNAGGIRPSEPGLITPLNMLLDTLNMFTDQCFEAGFLLDNSFSAELKGRVNNAKQYLSISDSMNCARQIKWYQLSVLKVYSDSAGSYPRYVNTYGYKFLYYYPQYILGRLPEAGELQNDIKAKVNASIINTAAGLQFTYSITNNAASSQPISNIYVTDKTSNAVAGTPQDWLSGRSGNVLVRYYTYDEQEFIHAGSSLGGFQLTANSLPRINNIYIQSERFAVDTNDIKTNSFIAQTVVPAVKPPEINSLEFIDTLIDLNKKSYVLGWIPQRWVRDVNNTHLLLIKTLIKWGLPKTASVLIASFEKWVEQTKKLGYIKDEAYVLLKYNSQYLREEISK